MLVASLVTFLEIVVLQMEVLSTLLARLAISVESPVTSLATAHRRLPTVTFLVMLSILVLPLWSRQLLPSHRSSPDRHCSIGLDELSINQWNWSSDFLTL